MSYPPIQDLGKPERKSRTWLWILLSIVGILCLSCGGCLTWLIVLAANGPDTSVYAGNQVPAKFVETMRELGALDDDERLLYFYSDGFGDIKTGFYTVSDRRVVVYTEDGVEPLISIPFKDIENAELERDESFFDDSVITLNLTDGQPVMFPVSSEHDGDKKFYSEIKKRIND